MSQLFVFLYQYFQKRKALFITLLVLFIGSCAYWGSKLQFEEDVARLMPADEKVSQLSLILENSNLADRLVFHISQTDTSLDPNPDLLVEYAEVAVEKLREKYEPDLIAYVQAQVSDDQMLSMYDFFYEHLPLFLDESDYEEIEKLIEEEKLTQNFERNFKLLLSPASAMLKQQVLRDPVGITPLALRKLQNLQVDENFDLYQGYVMTKDQRHLLFFVSPAHKSSETDANIQLLEGMSSMIDSLAQDSSFQEVYAEYYGGTAVAVANAVQVKKDVFLTVSLAVLSILILIGFFYKRLQIFVFIGLPILFGAGLALMCMYWIRGEISAISLGIGSVLIGITIDYSLHIFTHYRAVGDVKQVIKDVSLPMLTSCLTTATAFLCLLMLSSGVMNDLGLLAAIGVSGAAIFSLVILPHLLPFTRYKANTQHHTWVDRLGTYAFSKNKWLVLTVLVITIICVFSARRATFEGDLTHLNYLTDELAQAERRLDEISDVSRRAVFLLAIGDDLEEALENTENVRLRLDSLKAEGLIKSYANVSELLKSRDAQQQLIERWQNFWTEERKAKVVGQVQFLAQSYNFTPEAFQTFYDLFEREFEYVTLEDLEPMRQSFLNQYLNETEDGKIVAMSILKIDREDTKEIYKRLDDQEGVSILDRQYITNRFLEILAEDFDVLVKISLLLVFLILVHVMGRLELGIISFLPILISWLWVTGLMGLLGLSFNVFNVIISTFIFGLGIDYSIFVMRGLLQEYKLGVNHLPSYKSSILLSAFTTLAGIGVLVFAKHPALQSIAFLSIIGISSVVLIAFTLEPLMFRWLVEHEGKKRNLPITFPDLIVAIMIFLIFLIGTILLTAIGILFFNIIPWWKEPKKLFFHRLISWLSKGIVYISFHIRKRVLNPHKETFEKPAIIISNHQSHIDLVLLMMLHPKLIILTNDWVWNNRFYGKIVKFADFYPVSQGFEEGLDKFKERVDAGYSILIFPEGSRSPDGNIKRFHKGAFLLAEKLNLDILPILLHGANDCMTKGEPFLRSGKVTVNILPRIQLADTQYGETYQARAKQVRRYMQGEFAKMREQIEVPAYFKHRLIKNYIYKGPVIEWYFRVKIRLEQNYAPFHELLPKQGLITDLGCGYGFMSYMLSFLSKDRELIGIDYDEEKITVANHCMAKNEQINFFHGDVATFPLKESDAFILADVLHYLRKSQQQELIGKCIEHLKPNGMLIIRDGNTEMKDKHQGTKLTEFFSTRLFSFNKTTQELEFLSKQDIETAIAPYPVSLEVLDSTKFTSNLVYVLRLRNHEIREKSETG